MTTGGRVPSFPANRLQREWEEEITKERREECSSLVKMRPRNRPLPASTSPPRPSLRPPSTLAPEPPPRQTMLCHLSEHLLLLSEQRRRLPDFLRRKLPDSPVLPRLPVAVTCSPSGLREAPRPGPELTGGTPRPGGTGNRMDHWGSVGVLEDPVVPSDARTLEICIFIIQ